MVETLLGRLYALLAPIMGNTEVKEGHLQIEKH